jgi:hypothetical protein
MSRVPAGCTRLLSALSVITILLTALLEANDYWSVVC